KVEAVNRPLSNASARKLGEQLQAAFATKGGGLQSAAALLGSLGLDLGALPQSVAAWGSETQGLGYLIDREIVEEIAVYTQSVSVTERLVPQIPTGSGVGQQIAETAADEGDKVAFPGL